MVTKAPHEEAPYRLSVGLAVLDHLSEGLYSSVAAVVTEAVANAWDADATKVQITIDVQNDQIRIIDNGHGMDRQSVNDRFLRIAYQRRSGREAVSPNGRPVMGRKGIGKLSLFSIADVIEVETKTATSDPEALKIDVREIRNSLSNNSEIRYLPPMIPAQESWEGEHGTIIRLSSLKEKRLRELGAESLRRRLARRFSVIGTRDFSVSVDGSEVTWRDRGDLSLSQYVWIIEGTAEPEEGWGLPVSRRYMLPNRHESWPKGQTIRGWLATVDKPRSLSTPEGNLNSIVVLARGRLVLEDILPAVGRGELFTKYLTGQIEADFLDEDGLDDIVTSDRQRLREEDDRVQMVRSLLRKHLSIIESKWSELRTADRADDALDEFPKLQEWIRRLDPGWQRKARSLIGRVASMDFETAEDRNSLLRSSILGFERLRIRGESEELERALERGVDALLRLLSQRDDLEAALYRDIVRNRLMVINELERSVAANDRERVLQRFLFEHLWLLDPAWERAAGSEAMEKRLQLLPEFKEDEKSKRRYGRVDIRYRTAAGKHVIVELKRAAVLTGIYDLGKQGNSYVQALRGQLEPSEQPRAQIEVVFVVGRQPDADASTIHGVMQSVAPGSRLITYDTLISRARAAYNEFLSSTQKADILDAMLEDSAKEAD